MDQSDTDRDDIDYYFTIFAGIYFIHHGIRNGCSFFPEKISFYAYQYIIRQGEKILRAYGVTILITVVGTFFNLMFTALLAYPLSVKTLPYRRQITFFVFFTFRHFL